MHYNDIHDRAIKDCQLILTCFACPEQYDVYSPDGKQIGYLRLRHGHFTATYPDVGGDLVYESDTRGDGCFDDDEREEELTKATAALLVRHVLAAV